MPSARRSSKKEKASAAASAEAAKADAAAELAAHEKGESVLDKPAAATKKDVEAAVKESASKGGNKRVAFDEKVEVLDARDDEPAPDDKGGEEGAKDGAEGGAAGAKQAATADGAAGAAAEATTQEARAKALVAERMRRNREATILERAEELLAEERQRTALLARVMKSAGAGTPAAAVPGRCTAHWDFVLSEMRWLSTDVIQERR